MMAEPEGLRKAGLSNALDCLTGTNGTIEAKRFSGGLSNRDGPPESKTAAEAGTSDGGKAFIGQDTRGKFYTDREISSTDILAVAATALAIVVIIGVTLGIAGVR